MNPIPKPSKKTKRTKRTASEKRHSAAIHEMRCIVTGQPTVIEHHCFNGGGGRKDHFKTIPLAPYMHTKVLRQAYGLTTRRAIHENRKLFEETYGTENELLLRTYEALDNVGRLEPKAREIWGGMR